MKSKWEVATPESKEQGNGKVGKKRGSLKSNRTNKKSKKLNSGSRLIMELGIVEEKLTKTAP